MKRLYLTAVVTVPSEEGQKRIDEALEKVCTLCNKQKPISSFNKEKYIKEVADKWKNLISDQVYQAMYNYQVEITD